jgi:hypothetical protein
MALKVILFPEAPAICGGRSCCGACSRLRFLQELLRTVGVDLPRLIEVASSALSAANPDQGASKEGLSAHEGLSLPGQSVLQGDFSAAATAGSEQSGSILAAAVKTVGPCPVCRKVPKTVGAALKHARLHRLKDVGLKFWCGEENCFVSCAEKKNFIAHMRGKHGKLANSYDVPIPRKER